MSQAGVTPELIPELSGLAASRRHPGVFWAHNDSDHEPVLYALDVEARVLAEFALVGAEPFDVEAVAVAPCEAGSCILLGDIGDNDAKRDMLNLLRLPEPEQLDSQPQMVEALPFAYEDGPRDAESLVVQPDGQVYVLTKPLGALAEVYRIDGLGPARTGQALRVATLAAQGFLQRAATDASLSGDGTRLLVRTYFGAWLFEHPGDAGVEALIAVQPREVNAPSQPQGEAITFLPDGSGYLLGSEKAGAPMFRVDCLPAAGTLASRLAVRHAPYFNQEDTMAENDRKPQMSPSQEIAAGAPLTEKASRGTGEEDWATRTGGPHTESHYSPETIGRTDRPEDRAAGEYHGNATPDNLADTPTPRGGRD